MIRKAFYWREDQQKFIEGLPGDAASHIRLALDEYIAKKKNNTATASPSGKGNNAKN